MDLGAIPSGHVKNLVAENAALKAALLPVRMLQVPSAYGPLDAFKIDPPGFEPAKKWPVVMYVYGGPDAPTTADRFGGLYDQLLAREGFIVFSIDGPASQADSDDNVRLLFQMSGPARCLARRSAQNTSSERATRTRGASASGAGASAATKPVTR